MFGALASDEEALKGLVTNLNRTLGAFASQENNLRAAIPLLRDVLRDGQPALRSLNSALPPLRGFARDALPGARSAPATLDAQLPFLRQARALVSPRELLGLTEELLTAVPRVTRLNKRSTRTFAQTRALSSCQNSVLLPFSKEPIPDPDFPKNSGEPFYEQSVRSFVGLSGESRLADANSPYFRVQLGGGPETIINTASTGEQVFAQAPFRIDLVRPAKPAKQPVFRPGIPCETQQPPDLNAPAGQGDESVRLSSGGASADERKRTERSMLALREVADHLRRTQRGLPSVDPLVFAEQGRAAGAEAARARAPGAGRVRYASARGRSGDRRHPQAREGRRRDHRARRDRARRRRLHPFQSAVALPVHRGGAVRAEGGVLRRPGRDPRPGPDRTRRGNEGRRHLEGRAEGGPGDRHDGARPQVRRASSTPTRPRCCARARG